MNCLSHLDPEAALFTLDKVEVKVGFEAILGGDVCEQEFLVLNLDKK